jgi:hypothetical protein
VALGCGGLLLLSGIGAAVAFFMARSAAEEFSSKLEEASKGSAGSGSVSGGAAVTSGGECAKAAACCEAMVTKTGGGPDALKGCEALKNMPNSVGCAQALETYKKAAPLAGFKCE